MRVQPSDMRGALVGMLTVGAVVIGALLLWEVSQVILVVFAAVLFALLLDSLAQLAQHLVHIPRAAALTLVTVLLAGALGAFGWLAGPQAADQIAQLSERMPGAVAKIRAMIEAQSWGAVLLESTPPPEQLVPTGTDLLSRISGVFSTALGAIVNLGLVLIIGLYLAIDPSVYVRGIVALLPASGRERCEHVLAALGHALRWWLVGRVAAMFAVGVLTGIGLLLIDMPLVLALSIIAGLLSFVPFVGPVLAVLPAALIALAENPVTAVWVLAIYGAVQFLEGNLITPLIEQRTVSVPPAVVLTSQLLMGVLFGFLGVLLATPLVVVCIVVTQILYLQGVLGRSVRVLGDHGRARMTVRK